MRVVNPVSLCENGFRLVAGANCSNVSVGQSPIPMIKAVVVSPLFRRIGVVFGFGSDAKMRGIDARRVIAGMHDHHVGGDFSNIKLIGIPMSANGLFAGHQKDAVSVLVASAFPFPAAIRFFKTVFKNVSRAKDWVISKLVSRSHADIALAAQFTSNSFRVITFNAVELSANLVSHVTPPVRQLYAITEV